MLVKLIQMSGKAVYMLVNAVYKLVKAVIRSRYVHGIIVSCSLTFKTKYKCDCLFLNIVTFSMVDITVMWKHVWSFRSEFQLISGVEQHPFTSKKCYINTGRQFACVPFYTKINYLNINPFRTAK